MALESFLKFLRPKKRGEVHLTGGFETPLRLHNTRSGKKEIFTPLHAGQVRMYNCGPTVYSAPHIGNLRSYVFADTLRRTLQNSGLTVKQVINITDVGHLTSDADDGADKMEEGAKRDGRLAKDIAHTYTQAFLADISSLNVATEDVLFPRATEHISDQIILIKDLETKGYTYTTSDGIYFDTAKFPHYGALGHIDIAGLKEGARVTKNEEKRNPTDFALWKFSPKGEQRQQEWSSPWGIGFPGWHIECSAMSMKYLGSTLDIHTGGIDHIPVHHNNEIAQSEASTGRTFARYWMHNEFLNVDGRKISKSLNNSITLKDLRERNIPPLALRYFMLSAHYRTPLNFTWEAIAGSAQAMFRLHTLMTEQFNMQGGAVNTIYLSRFRERMHNDLDTPRAIALIWELVRDPNISPADKRATLLSFNSYLGLGIDKKDADIALLSPQRVLDESDIPDEIRSYIKEREEARKHKNWMVADELRKKIEDAGYTLKDTDTGTTVSPKSTTHV
jgi:cysteinyl-tRNA synthetase